jgi:hypothetical protein
VVGVPERVVPRRGRFASWASERRRCGRRARDRRRDCEWKLATGASQWHIDGSDAGWLPARYNALYRTFANAWRVNDKDSLFDYAPGTSTQTFTDRDWPSERPPCRVRATKPLEPGTEALAVGACWRIADRNRRADCVFDVTATGDVTFAKTYLATERLLASSTTTTLTSDGDATQVGEWVVFTAAVVPSSSGAVRPPSGTVQFAVDGSNVGGPIIVNSKGWAVWTTSQLKVGAHRITAGYLPGADSVFLPSTSLEKLHTVRRCNCDADREHK